MNPRLVVLTAIALSATAAAAAASPAAPPAHDCLHVDGVPPTLAVHPEHCVPGGVPAGTPSAPGARTAGSECLHVDAGPPPSYGIHREECPVPAHVL